jgi:flagellar biosynthetic protein FliR
MNLTAVLLAWLRASALLVAFPQALGISVPVLVRAMVAGGLALILASGGTAAAHGGIGPALGEVLMGLGLGFCLRLPMFAVESAGETMGHGTTAASLLMPSLSQDAGGGGNAWQAAFTWLGLLVWFSVGGPEALIQALAGSARLVPLGHAGLGTGLTLAQLSPLAARAAALAMVLCLPPVLASILVQWGLGLVFRASARLHLYGFALPVASLAAAGALALAVPTWPALLSRSLGWSVQAASVFSAGMVRP